MKPLLVQLLLILSFLQLFTACKEKRIESATYGDFRYEIIYWERKRLMWEGYDNISSEHILYFKGEKLELEKLSNDFLKEKTIIMDDLTIDVISTFFHRDSALYCKLDAGEHSTIGILTTARGELKFIPLVNQSLETSYDRFFSFYKIDSVGDQKTLMTNYLFSEKPFRLLAQFEPIIRHYDNSTGDTTAACEVNTSYGMSPDGKIIVRSFFKHMLPYPELCRLFLTEINTGKTKEFPLMEGETPIVDFYNTPEDSISCHYWFRKNFEWIPENGSYTLKIKKTEK